MAHIGQPDIRQQYLHPIWVRIWHWSNAAFFVALIITGFSMHFGGAPAQVVSFQTSRIVHNVSGWLLIGNFVAYIVGLVLSSQWRQYLRFDDGFAGSMLAQARYYAGGILRGEPHPEHPTEERKFNALQQVTYLGIMALVLPLIIITGIMLQFPETAPKEILGSGGVWPLAVLHTIVAYLLIAFTIGHVYLTTTGETPDENIRAMVTGWHDPNQNLDNQQAPSTIDGAPRSSDEGAVS
jgi:thiosulfate reductase cytochrome b subunit